MNDPGRMNGQTLTVTIRGLRVRNNGAEISATVVLESGENSETRTLPLTMRQYCELNLRKGPISEEQFEELERASRSCMAVRCGENLLAYGSNTVQALSRKIMRHGFSKEEAVAAAEHLREIGLIDENRDLQREVEKCVRKLWGAGRIKAQLRNRGFGKETMEELSSLLDGIDFVENCAALIQKRYGGLPEDQDSLRRMTAGLYRYGYTPGEIRSAMRRLREEQEESQ